MANAHQCSQIILRRKWEKAIPRRAGGGDTLLWTHRIRVGAKMHLKHRYYVRTNFTRRSNMRGASLDARKNDGTNGRTSPLRRCAAHPRRLALWFAYLFSLALLCVVNIRKSTSVTMNRALEIHALSNYSPNREHNQARSAAIVYLTNEDQMVRQDRVGCPSLFHSLESLARHFPSSGNFTENGLSPQPIVFILYNGQLKNTTRAKVKNASPFPVVFHELDFSFERQDKAIQPGIDMRGFRYRKMCTFWLKSFFDLDILPEYVMRLDSDTCLTSNLTVDPFKYMHENQMDYMWHSTFAEPANVLVNLSDFVMRHPGRPNTDHKHDPLTLWMDDTLQKMQVFSTNLEWFRMSAFRREEIVEWIEDIDQDGGVYRHRWGDAPLRTILATQFFNSSQVGRFCDFSYNHSVWKPFESCDASHGKRFTDMFGWKVAGSTP